MSESASPRIAVIGGGVGGLAAAHRLRERAHAAGSPPRVTLFEAANRLGGVIRTVRRDGFLLEEGPDSFLLEKEAGRSLVERLGLASRLLAVRPESRRSYLVHRHRLVPTPEGFQLLGPVRVLPFLRTPVLTPAAKLRVLIEPLVPARRDGGDESLGAFVERRLGREALERLAQPMVAGIYGADPYALSLASTFPRFLEMERRDGSVLLGLRRTMRRAPAAGEASGPRYGLFATFDSGMQVLTDRLAAAAAIDDVRLSHAVRAIVRHGEGGWSVDGEIFDRLLIALPAPVAARLLDAVDSAAARLLEEIPYGGAATVSLAYRSEQVAHPMRGAGFVSAAVEGLSILGCTFAHRKFAGRAPEGHALLRAFLGDRARGLTDDALVARTRSEIEPLLGVRGEPRFTHVARYEDALPRYPVGHRERLARLDERLRPLIGLALAGPPAVGAGVPDVVAAAEAAADRLLEL